MPARVGTPMMTQDGTSMAKRKNVVASARGRKVTPVKKPFPVATVLGSTVLAAVLIGVIVFAAQNQGLGDKSSLTYAQSQIDGLRSVDDLSQKHVDADLKYPDEATTPPIGGEHNQVPQSCQVYAEPIANENAVHSLEHGAAWVTYNPDSVKGGDLDKLKKLVDGDPYRMLSPYKGLKDKVSLQAWGEQLFVSSVSDNRIEEFLKLFTNGPQTKEPGAACVGTTETGPLVVAPVAPAPTATPKATPQPTPTK